MIVICYIIKMYFSMQTNFFDLTELPFNKEEYVDIVFYADGYMQ